MVLWVGEGILYVTTSGEIWVRLWLDSIVIKRVCHRKVIYLTSLPLFYLFSWFMGRCLWEPVTKTDPRLSHFRRHIIISPSLLHLRSLARRWGWLVAIILLIYWPYPSWNCSILQEREYVHIQHVMYGRIYQVSSRNEFLCVGSVWVGSALRLHILLQQSRNWTPLLYWKCVGIEPDIGSKKGKTTGMYPSRLLP